MVVPLMITIPTTDVQHKIIHKRFSPQRKEKSSFIFVKIVENWTPLGFYYKFTPYKEGLLLHTYSSTVEILEN